MTPLPGPLPTGLDQVDGLVSLERPTLQDYINAASEYVTRARTLTDGQKKAGQIRLSAGLARVLVADLRMHLPDLHAIAGERKVSGALSEPQVDVSEFHVLDGLRLAVELKPVNLAVGRAIWNRFGDIRSIAVNVHLKFPFAVVGGVLAIPTYEEEKGLRKDTRHLIQRAIERLVRAGGRRTEGDAPHLLEGVGVIVYDPDTAQLDEELPPFQSSLRWSEFVLGLATAYQGRFGG